MPTTTTERMKQIVDDLRRDGYYTAANSVDAITAERDQARIEIANRAHLEQEAMRQRDQARAERDGLLEQLGNLKGKENRYRNLYESAESKLASITQEIIELSKKHIDAQWENTKLTQELEQLRAGYAGAVEVLYILQGCKVDMEGSNLVRKALSSTPQSVKDVMDVLEAAKDYADHWDDIMYSVHAPLLEAVRKLEAKE